MLLIRNMYWKKLGISLMLLASIMLVMTAFPGCSEQPTAPSKKLAEEPNQPEEGLDPEIQAFIAKGECYEQLIAAMDPFVTENTDGTFSFDNKGFFQVNSSTLTGDDLMIVEELKRGIPVVNQKIIDERKSHSATALGSACWWYWWGKRCCYWGGDAHYRIMIMSAGGAIMGISGLSAYAAWATYLTYLYGGFCLNGIWGGPIWLSAP